MERLALRIKQSLNGIGAIALRWLRSAWPSAWSARWRGGWLRWFLPVRNWAFEELPDAVIVFDARGRVRDANRAARALFEIDESFFSSDGAMIRLLPGRYARRLFGTRRGLGRIESRAVARMADRWWKAKALRPATGIEFPIEASIKRAPAALQALYVAFVRDVTDRQRAQQDLMRAREEAILASTAKSEFLANMSHEIRTPLNAVIGMADLLAETALQEDQRKYVSICRRAGRTLLAIVNDVLDLSKIEAGQLQLESIDFDLHALIETVAELMALRAHEKNLRFSVRIAPDAPQIVRGDPNRVRQIALNLLGNAIKFTSQGEVALELTRLRPEGGAAIAVRDSGAGMPAEFLERIFDKFAQADSSITRKHGGTGLGLAISRQLAEAMGGGIEVRSRPGKGSEFTVRLPLAAAKSAKSDVVDDDADALPSIAPPSDSRRQSTGHSLGAPAGLGARWFLNLEGVEALIADESAASARSLVEALEGWGARATAVRTLSEARVALQAAAMAGRPVQLALLSARAGGGRALADFVAEARGANASGGAPGNAPGSETGAKFFALMHERDRVGSDALRLSAAALGCDAALVRPVKRSELMETIARARGWTVPRGDAGLGSSLGTAGAPARAAERSVERSPRPPEGKPRILVVEDSADNRALVEAYLRSGGFALDVAEDGAAGVEKAKECRYGLILMDMQMPVMDGYSATQEIRRWEREHRSERTPILALTAHALREEVRRCLDAGCDGHLAKPVNKLQLLETIQLFAKPGKAPEPPNSSEGVERYGPKNG